jgi:hypothetical protein
VKDKRNSAERNTEATSRRAIGEVNRSDFGGAGDEKRIDTLESALFRSLERGKRLIDSFSPKQPPSAGPVRKLVSKIAKSACAAE